MAGMVDQNTQADAPVEPEQDAQDQPVDPIEPVPDPPPVPDPVPVPVPVPVPDPPPTFEQKLEMFVGQIVTANSATEAAAAQTSKLRIKATEANAAVTDSEGTENSMVSSELEGLTGLRTVINDRISILMN